MRKRILSLLLVVIMTASMVYPCSAEDSASEIYDSISLTLSSDISMNFYMELGADALEKGEMVFTIGNRTVESVTAKFNEEKGKYYFACPLNALEMAETVTATFTYESTTYTQTYSIVEYIKEILDGNYSDKAKKLARKIAVYGYHAQLYLQSIHQNVTIGGEKGYADMLTNFEELSEFKDDIDTDEALNLEDKFTVTPNTEIFTFDGRTVYFDSATALNFYIITADGEEPKATCDEDKTITVKLYKGNTYIVSVTDIAATELGKTFTVVIGEGKNSLTIKSSVLDYCAAVIGAHKGKTDDADKLAVNAMAAFYEYHLAAQAYADSTAFPHHDTLNEYSWEELKTVSNAISDGTISAEEMAHFIGFANEAQTKKVVLKNDDVMYVRIIGFNHDTLSRDFTKKAGITFMSANSLNQGFYSGNNGNDTSTYAVGWAGKNGNSPLREKMQSGGSIYTLLPSELLCQIQQVKKCSRAGWTPKSAYDDVLVTSDDYLFLLSGNEIGTNYFNPADKSDTEGEKYAYIDCVPSFYPQGVYGDSGVLLSNVNATGYEFIMENAAGYDNIAALMFAVMEAGGTVDCNINDSVLLRSVSTTLPMGCGAFDYIGNTIYVYLNESACIAPCFCI